MKNRYAVAPWRQTWHHNIRQLCHTWGVVAIEFNNDSPGVMQPGGRVANTAGKPDAAVICHPAGFDHRHINRPEKAVVNHLRHFAQMQIDEVHLAPVDLLPQSRCGLGEAHTMNSDEFERIQGMRREVYDSHDYQEGMNAFLEKRKPVFIGR